MSRMTYMEGVVYKKVDKEVNKEVDKEVDEYETYAVKKELNEGSELEDEVMVVEVIMKLTVVMEMMWCWIWRLTWRLTRKRPMLPMSTSFLMSEEFEGPHGHYIMEKGLLHVNYVLTLFLVETT